MATALRPAIAQNLECKCPRSVTVRVQTGSVGWPHHPIRGRGVQGLKGPLRPVTEVPAAAAYLLALRCPWVHQSGHLGGDSPMGLPYCMFGGLQGADGAPAVRSPM